MGLFKGIKNNYKKSEAAVVVQNLLEIQSKNGMFDLDPAATATRLVELVWTSSPHLFDGRFGQRPHKLSVAAAAFANGIDVLDANSLNRHIFALCLGTILNELEVNGKLYPFSSLDRELLGAASQILVEFSDVIARSPLGQEVSELITNHEHDTWEQWYDVYKKEAGKQNPGLEPDENGMSLIDFMEDEPLRRAFRDGMDPRSLGRQFADQFDITKMGM